MGISVFLCMHAFSCLCWGEWCCCPYCCLCWEGWCCCCCCPCCCLCLATNIRCRIKTGSRVQNDSMASVHSVRERDIKRERERVSVWEMDLCSGSSVPRLGELMHFEKIFKDCGSNYFAKIAHILGNFCTGVKVFHFSSFYRHLATAYWSHCLEVTCRIVTLSARECFIKLATYLMRWT